MTSWEFVDKFLREPPWVIVLILVAILVSHAFKIVWEFFAKRPRSNALFITLETLVVIVLSYLSIHLYLSRYFERTQAPNWNYEPLLMTLILVVFTYLSLRLYSDYKNRS